jgi:hypothetical protein
VSSRDARHDIHRPWRDHCGQGVRTGSCRERLLRARRRQGACGWSFDVDLLKGAAARSSQIHLRLTVQGRRQTESNGTPRWRALCSKQAPLHRGFSLQGGRCRSRTRSVDARFSGPVCHRWHLTFLVAHAKSRTNPSHSSGAELRSMTGVCIGSERGQRGVVSGHMPASSQLWFALRQLQDLQLVTIFVHVV